MTWTRARDVELVAPAKQAEIDEKGGRKRHIPRPVGWSKKDGE